jgi:expansin (peptidoglycan-binding protein)
MNEADYGTSALCGACVEVTGPRGATTVRITDRCPECAPGDIDLAAAVFAEIADPIAGRVPITWEVVPCVVSGPVRYFFKDGSNPWWLAVQVRDHRHPIASLEMLGADGTFQALRRERYNFFINDQSPGEGPYTFRITDAYGHTQIDRDIPFAESQARDGQAQLPACQ